MKKLNIKGFSHLEVLLTLLVIVAVAGISVFGYQRFKTTNESKAAAGGWTKILTYSAEDTKGVTVQACRVKTSASKYRLKVMVKRADKRAVRSNLNYYATNQGTDRGPTKATAPKSVWTNANTQVHEVANLGYYDGFYAGVRYNDNALLNFGYRGQIAVISNC